MSSNRASNVVAGAIIVALLIVAFTVGQNTGAGGSPIMGDGAVSCEVYEDGSAVCEFTPGREWAEHGGTLSGCLSAPERYGVEPYLCSD